MRLRKHGVIFSGDFQRQWPTGKRFRSLRRPLKLCEVPNFPNLRGLALRIDAQDLGLGVAQDLGFRVP